jgi:phosphoglucomutase
LRQRKEAGELDASDYIVKSFVSTTMADKIAEKQGAACITVPTGFKYIADVINTRKEGTFIFGFEESCGFLAGDFVMDKDGVMAMLLMLEVACECKETGETLYQRLRALYDTHGWHKEKVISAVMEGQGGMEKIGAIMKRLRETPPGTLGGQSVIGFTDYQSGLFKGADGVKEIDFPCENALKFTLENGWVSVRPSGTEPKIKLYVAVWGDTKEEAEKLFNALEEDAGALTGV